ncbi:MAG: WecB/TagA/CpsF family glycosyltransferase [Phycisphaerales bacterium]
MPLPPRIALMGVEIDRVTMRGAVDHIDGELRAGRGGWVVTPNLEILRRLRTDPEVALLCAPAELRLADGMPLVWASRLRGTPLPERVAGSDLIWSLCEHAARGDGGGGWSVFLLGGNPGAADAAAGRLAAGYPGLRIAGVHCPPMGFEGDEHERAEIRRRLSEARPDIVFVGLGSPKQERLIVELRPDLPRAWFLGIGVTFSFVAGEMARAPAWMRRTGLEWFHRLITEPRRLGKRYLVHGVPFALRLLGVSFVEGVPRLWGWRTGRPNQSMGVAPPQ